MSQEQQAGAGGPALRPRFEALRNFRDLGGVPGADGQSIAPGRLFRSAVLSRLTASDMAAFEALGVSDVFDLRLEDEVERHRTVDLAGVTIRNHGLRVIDLERVFDAALAAPAAMTAAETARAVQDGYASSLERMAPQLSRLFTEMATGGTGGALVHCMTGKDRTGVVIALLLAALGVDRERIVADYVETARNISADKLTDALVRQLEAEAGRPADRAVLYPLFEARPGYIGAMLNRLNAGHRGAEAYFAGTLGLSRDELDMLRRRFLQAPVSGADGQ